MLATRRGVQSSHAQWPTMLPPRGIDVACDPQASIGSSPVRLSPQISAGYYFLARRVFVETTSTPCVSEAKSEVALASESATQRIN